MFGILLSALNTVLMWLVRSVVVKFVVYFAVYFLASEFMAYLAPHLPGAGAITQALSNIPSGMWYFFDLFQLGLGIKLVLSAHVTRFAIRRMPVVG